MSADNFIGVRPIPNTLTYLVVHGFMSPLSEDCQYEGSELARCQGRELALVKAHDLAKQESVLEYGVIELDPIPLEPCGRCYLCVHERGIIDSSLEKCDGCENVISASETHTYTQGKVYHSSCEMVAAHAPK